MEPAETSRKSRKCLQIPCLTGIHRQELFAKTPPTTIFYQSFVVYRLPCGRSDLAIELAAISSRSAVVLV